MVKQKNKVDNLNPYWKIHVGWVLAAFIFFIITTISNFSMPNDGNQFLGFVNLLISIALGTVLFAWMTWGEIN
jgi:hypothetical protein